MEINAALADPKIKARLADMGGAVIAGSPVDFGASNQSILPRYVSPMEARNSSSLASHQSFGTGRGATSRSGH
jgi:hypothetical protein